MILNHQNLLANHQILQVALQAAEQQLLIYLVGQICDAVGTPKLKQTELDFLKEYVFVVEPLAVTLDQLRGNKECFLGMLLPKLIQLRYRRSVFSRRNLVY